MSNVLMLGAHRFTRPRRNRSVSEENKREVDALVVDEGFSLVHINGHIQLKREWFRMIRCREFNYHSIDVDERALSIKVAGRTAIATDKRVFDATINGMRSPWRLHFTVRLANDGDGWKIRDARYATF